MSDAIQIILLVVVVGVATRLGPICALLANSRT